MRRRTPWWMAAVLCLVAACDGPNFEGASEITKLRTLAIGMEPAELGPGEVGTLEAFSVTPDPERPIVYGWEVCLFDDGPDERYRCSVDPETGEMAGIVLPGGPTAAIPYDVITSQLGSIDEICDAFASFDLPDFIEPPSCDRGLPLRVRLTATSGDEEEIAVREILLLREAEAARADRNENPSVDGIVLAQRDDDGVVLSETALPEGEVTTVFVDLERQLDLQAVVDTDASTQAYEPFDENGERLDARDERLRLTWYATHGNLNRETTYFATDVASATELQANEWKLTKNTEAVDGDRVTLWLVLRDNRGGVDVAQRTIEVRAVE